MWASEMNVMLWSCRRSASASKFGWSVSFWLQMSDIIQSLSISAQQPVSMIAIEPIFRGSLQAVTSLCVYSHRFGGYGQCFARLWSNLLEFCRCQFRDVNVSDVRISRRSNAQCAYIEYRILDGWFYCFASTKYAIVHRFPTRWWPYSHDQPPGRNCRYYNFRS